MLLSASSKSGASRAKFLDRALEYISQGLGGLTERGDDPLFHFYGDVIQEILDLNNKKGEMANKYLARQSSRADWLSSEEVFTKLAELKSEKDYAGAINYIEGCLNSKPNDLTRWRLEYSRQVYLEWSDKHEKALKNCQRLLSVDGISSKYREALLGREAFNLFQLNRVTEGLAQFDQRIQDAADDQDSRLRLLGQKAQLMFRRDPVTKSIEVWQAYRNEAQRGTDDWYTATALLAREHRRANQFETALKLFDSFLEEDRDSWVLLEAAECQIALGNYDQARRYVLESEAIAKPFADLTKQSARERYDLVLSRISTLREKLTEQDGPPSSTEESKAEAE
jgi:tetratricopeptide (TPR) repeat protein